MSVLQGYTVPRTPLGRASLVPPPPWHYVGDFLVIDFHADPEVAASLLPEGLEPHPDAGRCAAVYADWQSCSEHGDELRGPVPLCTTASSTSWSTRSSTVRRSRRARSSGSTRTSRWRAGGSRASRRSSERSGRRARSGSSAEPRRDCGPGSRFGGTCSARGRAISRATVKLEGLSESGSLHTAPPIVNVRHFPRLAAGHHDDPQVHELVRSRSRDRSVSDDLGG